MATLLSSEQLNQLDESITSLDLSVRVINQLENQGVYIIRQLLECCMKSQFLCAQHCVCRERLNSQSARTGVTLAESWSPKCYLLDISGFAQKTLDEIQAAMAKKGFRVSNSC